MKFFYILFIIMVGSHWCFTQSDSPQMIGLMFDILGAYFLSQGLIQKSLKVLVEESPGNKSKPYLGTYRNNYFISMYTQIIEARTGFTLLCIGFTLQMVPSGISIPFRIGTFILLTSLPVICLIHKKLLVCENILKKIKARESNIDHEFWTNFYEELEMDNSNSKRQQ